MNDHMNFVTHLFQGVVATSAILAAESTFSTADWISMVERLGLAVALVIFFVVTGWAREKRMANRLDWLERENDKLSTRTATLAEQVNTAMTSAISFQNESLRILDGRMCWACKTRDEFEALQEIISERKQGKTDTVAREHLLDANGPSVSS